MPTVHLCLMSRVQANQPVRDPATMVDHDHGVQFLLDLYSGLLAHASAEIGTLFTTLADAEAMPAVFHSAVGKDRTGLIAALLLTWLGVDRELVLDDFEASDGHIGQAQRDELVGRMADRGIGPEAAAGVLGATPEHANGARRAGLARWRHRAVPPASLRGRCRRADPIAGPAARLTHAGERRSGAEAASSGGGGEQLGCDPEPEYCGRPCYEWPRARPSEGPSGVELLRALWRAAPRQALLWWAMIGLRGVTPALASVAFGWLVAEITNGSCLAAPLVAVGVTFFVMVVAQPLHQVISANLGSRLAAHLYDQLLKKLHPPGRVDPRQLIGYDSPTRDGRRTDGENHGRITLVNEAPIFEACIG